MRPRFLTLAILTGIALGVLMAGCSARPGIGASQKKTETTTRYGVDVGEYALGHPVTGQAPEVPTATGDPAPTERPTVLEVRGAEIPWRGIGIGICILLLVAIGAVVFLGRKRGGAVASILFACCALGLTACDEKEAGAKAEQIGGLVQSAGQATGLSMVALVGSLIAGGGSLLAGKKASIGQRFAEGGWSKDEVDELVAALRGQGYTITKSPTP